MFSCEFYEISKNTFLTENFWATAPGCVIGEVWIAKLINLWKKGHNYFFTIDSWDLKNYNLTKTSQSLSITEIYKYLPQISSWHYEQYF